MRKIFIYQKDSNNIEVLDDSDTPLDKYCEELSELMKMGNVAILQTSESFVILRPSKIISIEVKNFDLEQEKFALPDPPPVDEKAKEDEVEDIITDVDSN